MTELYELYKTDLEAFKQTITEMETGRLLAELDDTIQFDILKIDTVEWTKMKNKRVYNFIMSELKNRI